MTILVGYIPTPEGLAAVEAATQEASLRNSKLIVINSSPGTSRMDVHLVDDHALKKLEADLTEAGVDVEIRQLIRGHDAAEEILDAAQQDAAELIVIGLRHRTAVGKLLLGSTAQRILLHATCPVLSVKPDH
jgi:nucleotide-binding universal stress UspA family protein